jgi:hypothetical protein
MTSFIFPTMVPKNIEVGRKNTCHLSQVQKNHTETLSLSILDRSREILWVSLLTGVLANTNSLRQSGTVGTT